ncbi:hypothetical protein DMENIID0001_121610 [Sergentomyia squamirostris]
MHFVTEMTRSCSACVRRILESDRDIPPPTSPEGIKRAALDGERRIFWRRVRSALNRGAHHSRTRTHRSTREKSPGVRGALNRGAHHSSTRTRSPSREESTRVRGALNRDAHHSPEISAVRPSSTLTRSQRSRQRRKAALARFLRDQLQQTAPTAETSAGPAVPIHQESTPPPEPRPQIRQQSAQCLQNPHIILR